MTNSRLRDANTAETLTADDLGLNEDEYADLVAESYAPEAGDTGIVSAPGGRLVYAE